VSLRELRLSAVFSLLTRPFFPFLIKSFLPIDFSVSIYYNHYNDYRMSKRRARLFGADKSAEQKAANCFLQLYH
jgi:hypothetical protein